MADALKALAKAGIDECHLVTAPSNTAAREFRESVGWVERTDVLFAFAMTSPKAGG